MPHLTPLIRGIHATLYARIEKETDFQSLFEQHYANEPFVDVLPAKSHPETRSVRSANVCRIAVHRPQEAILSSSSRLSTISLRGCRAGGSKHEHHVRLRRKTGLWQLPVLP